MEQASRVARIESAMQHEGEITWSMQKGPAKFAEQKAVFIISENQRRKEEVPAASHVHQLNPEVDKCKLKLRALESYKRRLSLP